uniref:Kinectin 1 n=1 Tax=Callorhinchus milii TaxID=7868 RepID=A0A4W3GBG0_CALMI|eukprot:gi/632951760/ref/XP_007891477.1/ PREDICTED: kinectin isoform X1 [Callorhinchus milii]
MELYDSQYLLIIIPCVVIAVIFLFFWLFMKETSYDEVLAKQKRDVKPIPAKVDKKKSEKKKNKKKENPNGNLHESDSESAVRDMDLMDVLGPDEEPPVQILSPVVETSSGLKERKKKDKKSARSVHDETAGKDTEGLKVVGKRMELPVSKQLTPPDVQSSKRKSGHKKQKNGTDDAQDVRNAYIKEHTESLQNVTKKQDPVETKLHESAPGKPARKIPPKKQKSEAAPAVIEEVLIKSAVYVALMDNAEASASGEKKDPVDVDKSQMINSGVQKANAKKQRNEYDRENADIKFKDFISSLKIMTFNAEEAISVAEILREKPVLQDVWQKLGGKSDLVTSLQHQLQEKDKLLRAFQEESALSNEKCKQFSQELVTEKQKASVIETKLREQRSALEKELGALQNKLQVSYQDHMNETQMQFRQLQEQIEALQQENRILRDAVSKAPTQLENKQSTELNKLRQDYARLMNEFTEKTNRLQQEEVQKKNLEVSYEQTVEQLKAQLQEEVERRQEDMQKYLRNITTEHEKRLVEVQAAKQDLQSKLLVAENEIGNKNKEVQSLHSKLTDNLVSKQQLEEKVVLLLDAEQKRANTDDVLKLQAQELLEQKGTMNAQMQNLHAQLASQASAVCLVEDLHQTIAERENKLKRMEESLESERIKVANQEQEFQNLQKANRTLTNEIQKLQAQTSEQASALYMVEQMQKSIEDRDEKIKTVEELLETGLIQVANKGEEIEALDKENRILKQRILALEIEKAAQVSSSSLMADLHQTIDEQNKQIQSAKELLEAENIKMEINEREIQALKEDNEMLKQEGQEAQFQKTELVSTASKLEQAENIIRKKEQEVNSLKDSLSESAQALSNKATKIQDLEERNEKVILQITELRYQMESQVSLAEELQETVFEQERKINNVEGQLEVELSEVVNHQQTIKALQEEIETLQKKVQIAQHQKADQISAESNVKELENMIGKKEKEVYSLKVALEDSSKESTGIVSEMQSVAHENTILKIEIQELHNKVAEQEGELLKSELLLNVLGDKDQELTTLQQNNESLKADVEHQRKKNNELREKNWKAMEALTSTEKLLQDKVNKTAKESSQQVAALRSETKEMLRKLFPRVSVSSNLDYSDWMEAFERQAHKALSEKHKEGKMVTEHKLKENEEMLQLECEKYKMVLAETEGILQRLQDSVEEEEGKWKIKLDDSQRELLQMKLRITSLEDELQKLKREGREAENLIKRRDYLTSELEKVESERATYVTEVRELKVLLTELQKKLDDSCAEAIKQNEELNLLKTQLSETLTKLKTEQLETQKVVSNLQQAQESLNTIQAEIAKSIEDGSVVENSEISDVKEQLETKEKITLNLNQDVIHLQQLLQTLLQQLSKGRESSQNVIVQLEEKATRVLKGGTSV